MRITDLSLQEKILQTVVIRADKDRFVPDQIGAVFFGAEIITEANMGPERARALTAQYIDNAKIPVLITSDFENGCGSMIKGLTPFPYLMSLGAADNEQLAYDYGKATALEARSVGANWSFSPVSDLNINKRNPVTNVRAISDDPALASRLLKQVVRGMQEHGLAACAKHYPGDGMDYRDQHIVTTHNTLSLDEWKRLSGRVFKELIDDGVYSIMAGHITLSAYQKEVFSNGRKLPATLSHELISNLLKKEMGFQGVVVTDAQGMGGFNGWYPTKQRTEIESFKAGCDMMLWPTAEYVKNMTEAVENGYITMERLDDAVTRILTMKERLGMFHQDNHAITLTEQDHQFIQKTQKEVAEHSITLIRDYGNFLPLCTEKHRKLAVVPITHYLPALEEAKLLCEEFRDRGFEVEYFENGLTDQEFDEQDLVIFALFSRPLRPIGFQDFHGTEAKKIFSYLKNNIHKTMIVSFGSPYFGNQYFERAVTYINAYSMLAPSVKAFVRAATGEIAFRDFSPVNLQDS